MSECLSSQGLSPLQQNATVQQGWHLPAGWDLSLTSFPPLQFLPQERSDLFVQDWAISQWGTAASLQQLSTQAALPTSLGPQSIHLPCSCNVTTVPIYSSGVFTPDPRLWQRSAKISLLTPPWFQTQTFPKGCANTFATLSPWHFLKGFSVPWYPGALQKLESTNSVRPQPCEQFHPDFHFKRKNHGTVPKKKPQVLKSYD